MPSLYTSQIAVGATPTLLVSERLRYGLLIKNIGPGSVWVGGPAVSSSTGYQLDAGQSMALGGTQWSGAGGEASTAVYAISGGGSTVAVLEVW